jgi:AraC-like DNA-binding protein
MWAIAIAVFALLLAVGIWLFMRYRQRQQQRQNQELQQRIQELLEKYNQLSDSINTTESTAVDNEKLTQGDREFLERTINTINELIMKGQIDAQHVAEEMGMSLFQLRQRLGALIDETPQSFIQSIRMQRARHLLETHPEMTVSEIATLCAYNDTPNFTRAFKKMFGVTPTQFSDSGARPQ